MSDPTSDEDLASSLVSLAPTVDMAASHALFEHERNRRPRRRRVVFAAAAIVVGLGVAGLFVAGGREPSSNVPATQPTTESGPASVVEPSSTSGPPTIDDLRFSNPLGLGVVAVLDPAPMEPVNANAAVADFFPDVDWAWARDGSTDVWVIDDGEWAGMLSVTDFAIPWDIATSGMTPTSIGDLEAVVDTERSVVVLRRDDGVRRIQGGPDSPREGDPLLLDAAVELAELVGIGPLEAALPTDEFVPVTQTEPLSPSVTYDFTVNVQIMRFERPPTIDELRWGVAMVAGGNGVEQIGPWAFTARYGPDLQHMVELVSPVDAVVIRASSDADLDSYRNSLQFPTVAESGLTVVDDRPVEPTDVVARGEQDWGRWTVERSADGTCQSLTTAEWIPGGLVPWVTAPEPTCSDTPPLSPLVCDTNVLRSIVVAVGVDAASITLDIPDGFASTGFVDGEGGAAALIERDSLISDDITVRINDDTFTC